MQLFKNNAFSSLAAGLSAAATTMTLAAGQGDRFPEVGAPDFCMLTLQDAANNIEVVRVTARAGGADSLTIVRAQEGTTARSWSIGDIVELRITAFALNPLAILAGASTEAAIRALLDVPTRTGGNASGLWGINISGNAATATTAGTAGSTTGNAGTATALQTPRNINGTPFDGSADITTANWGTARLLTIGLTGKSVNGSGNVSWSLSEIGAAAADATVNLTGDQTVAGIKTFSTAPVVGTAAEKTANNSAASTAFVDRLRSLSTPATGATGTLVIGDRGSMVVATGAITVPSGVFGQNDVVTVYNDSAAAISLTQGAGLTMRQAGTANTGTRTLAAFGLATLVFRSGAVCLVSGAGVS